MSTCSNSTDVNALHPAASAGNTTVTLSYGAYMNWGRWNHNTSRVRSLIDRLVAANLAVQLRHDADESDRANHGWVSVLGPNGAELGRHEDVQHNRNYSKAAALMTQLADDVLAALAATPDADAETEDGCARDAEGALSTVTAVTEEAPDSCVLPPRKNKAASSAASRVFSREAGESTPAEAEAIRTASG